MSYYYALTPDQIAERKNAFHRLFRVDDNGYFRIADDVSADLNHTADYIGYLIYRSNRMMKKYKEKETNVMNYMEVYRKADYALEAFIRTIGLDSIKTANSLAYRMMNRFLTTDSL